MRAALLLLLPTLLAACASPAAPPVATAPSAAPLATGEIPAAPPGASPAIAEAWDELRSGGTLVPGGADASPEGRALAGYAALRAGDLDGALAAFRSATEAAPGLAVAAYGMGLVASAQGRESVAEEWYRSALESDPGAVRAAIRLRILGLEGLTPGLQSAELAEASGDLDSAIAAYAEATEVAPGVAAIYLRLATLEERQGDTNAAIETLERGRRAAGDRPVLLQRLAQLYGGVERYGDAYDALRVLRRLQPDDPGIAAAADEARRLYEEASLPEEYRALGDQETITREELAAILAIALEGLAPAVDDRPIVVSDIEGRWSAPFVRRLVRWRVLDVYQNNAFWPDLQVTRSMLVEAAYRVVESMGLADEAPRPRIQEPPPEHLLYRPVQVVVGLGVLDAGGDGSFDLLEPVSGAEAIEAAERLASAIRRLTS